MTDPTVPCPLPSPPEPSREEWLAMFFRQSPEETQRIQDAIRPYRTIFSCHDRIAIVATMPRAPVPESPPGRELLIGKLPPSRK